MNLKDKLNYFAHKPEFWVLIVVAIVFVVIGHLMSKKENVGFCVSCENPIDLGNIEAQKCHPGLCCECGHKEELEDLKKIDMSDGGVM